MKFTWRVIQIFHLHPSSFILGTTECNLLPLSLMLSPSVSGHSCFSGTFKSLMWDVLVPGDQRKNGTSQAFIFYSVHIAWLLSTFQWRLQATEACKCLLLYSEALEA